MADHQLFYQLDTYLSTDVPRSPDVSHILLCTKYRDWYLTVACSIGRSLELGIGGYKEGGGVSISVRQCSAVFECVLQTFQGRFEF